ncbi:MAG: hypothetical protein ACREOU_10590 [Candidatus Eiseniibacteriota bacterium]
MTPIVTEGSARADISQRIEATGRELRETLSAVLEAVAGPRPRPTRVARAIGLDKSLASRLVRAVQASSDLELMHLVPSPGGLQIFADLARRYADPASIENLKAATRRFDELLDSVPGGRASIDAQISESSPVALSRREHIAKQASFKAMSFLLGHFCDVLSTSLFLVPSANPSRIDGIEIHRRIGLRRMRPSTPLALLSLWGDASDAMSEHGIRMVTINGESGAANPQSFLLPAFSTQPLPELDVVRGGDMTTLVLPGDPTVHAPAQFVSAFRIQNGWPIVPEERMQSLRGYILHTPCVQMVRDIYLAETVFPDAVPQVSFLLPGPRERMRPPRADGQRHFSEADLSSAIQQLPLGPQAFEIPGVVNHSAAVRHVLERTGHAQTRFRGWRCSMTYPVTFVELMWWLSHPSVADKKTPAR